MYSHNFEQLAAAVYPFVRADVSLARVVDAMKESWRNKMAVTWTTDDVHAQANLIGRTITEGEARVVLEDLLRNHDAGVGINWTVIMTVIGMAGEDFGRPLTPAEKGLVTRGRRVILVDPAEQVAPKPKRKKLCRKKRQ